MKIRQLLENKAELLELQQAMIDKLDELGAEDIEVKVDARGLWIEEGGHSGAVEFEGAYNIDDCDDIKSCEEAIKLELDSGTPCSMSGEREPIVYTKVKVTELNGPSGGSPEVIITFPTAREGFKFLTMYTACLGYNVENFLIDELLEHYTEFNSLKAK